MRPRRCACGRALCQGRMVRSPAPRRQISETAGKLRFPLRLDRARRTLVGPSSSVVCRWVHRRMHQHHPDCRRNDASPAGPRPCGAGPRADFGPTGLRPPLPARGRPRARIARRRRVRPRWHRRLCGCRSVWFVHAGASAARRHPLLTAAVAGRPHLRTARLRRRLGKSHCGRGRLGNEHQRTDTHDHSDGEHADNATRKI